MSAYGIPSPAQVAAFWRIHALWRLQFIGYERAALQPQWVPAHVGTPDPATFLAWRSDLLVVARVWALSNRAEERRQAIVVALGSYEEHPYDA